ncbi:MAG: hypothetical protein MUF34_05940 [Polyangiaceae bacterium]|nr:hypothetical protein [Polyangiaceae bacterium]
MPGPPPVTERDPGGRPRVEDTCTFGGFGWQAQPFALYPDEQSCLGDQWVRYDEGLRLWVGLTTCSNDETRIYLATSPEGPFYAAADTAGHGQDHCELVNAAFTLTDEDDITSGGCSDCSTGPNLSLEGLPVYARSVLGEPFEFVASAPFWSHQVSRLRCGVELRCGAPPSGDGGGVTINDCAYGDAAYVAPKPSGGVDLVVLGVYETRSDHSGGYHPTGAGSVRDHRATPHVLVLSSYEPTHWTIETDEASGLFEVILNGYHEQTVSVSDRVKVTNQSGVENYLSACGIGWPNDDGGCDTPALVSGAEALTGLTLSSFNGCYRATSFEVRDGVGGGE